MAATWSYRTLAFSALALSIRACSLAACTVTSEVGTLANGDASLDQGPSFDAAIDGDAVALADVETDARDAARSSNGCAPEVAQEGDWVSLEVTPMGPPVTLGGSIPPGTYVLTRLRALDTGKTGAVDLRETMEVTSSGAGGAFARFSEKRNASGDYGQWSTGESRAVWQAFGPHLSENQECPSTRLDSWQFQANATTLTLVSAEFVEHTYTRVR